jgi:gliding motility-associated-like protein
MTASCIFDQMAALIREWVFVATLMCLFHVASSQNYSLNGDATTGNGSCITVTPNALWQNGSVWYTDLLDLSQPFTLEFQMNFGNVDVNGADGMAFVMQTVGPNAIGTDGAGFGFQGFNPSFGIEFDTYFNGDLGDLTADHVAFHRDGNIYHNLANNLAGPVNANASGQNIEDGQEHPVKIIWNPTTEVLELYFDCAFRLSATIDLVNTVFNGTNQVWWGFTGATGGLANAHVVCLAATYEFNEDLEYTICSGESVALSANGNPDGIFVWTPSAGLSNSSVQAPNATPSVSTEYCYTYTDVCGNVTSGCVQVNVEEPPAVNAGDDDVYCAGDTYLLEGICDQADATFQWATTAGNFTTATNEISAFIDAPGTYTLTAASAVAQCVGSDAVVIAETPLPQPVIDSPVSKCTYDSVVLDAGSNWQSVTWFDGTNTSTYSALTPGTYDVVIMEDDCEVAVSFVVNDIALQDVELGPTQAICEGQNAMLDAGTIVLWSDGTESQFWEPSLAGLYSAELEVQGCFERDTVEVVVVQSPYVELGSDTLFCEGQSLEIRSQEIGLWNTGETDDVIMVSLPGMYGIEVTQGPCVVVDSILVEQLPLPFVSLGDDPVYCEGTSYELTALGEFVDYYTWSTGDSTETLVVDESIDLAIEVGNNCGTSIDSLHVLFEDCSVAVYMPTSFTPNGDGINDQYWPAVSNVDVYDLKIFDKWGNTLFHSNDPEEPWIGDTMQGAYYVPNGVYNFLLVCRTDRGKGLERRGHIVVIR